MKQYKALFEKHHITPDIYADICDDDLVKIGVKSLGHRKQLLRVMHKQIPSLSPHQSTMFSMITEVDAFADQLKTMEAIARGLAQKWREEEVKCMADISIQPVFKKVKAPQKSRF